MIVLIRKLLVILLLFFGLFLFSCSKGITMVVGGSDSMMFPGYIQMQLDEDEYDIANTILLHISYGHDYSETFNANDRILKHTISIYTLDGNYTGNFENPSEFIRFYEVSYEGSDLGSDEYRCYPNSSLLSDVEFNKSFDLNLDMTEVDYNSGLLVLKFTENFVNADSIDGEIVEYNDVHHIYTFLYFLKDEATIQFSKTSFAK